ncbi:MAG: diadenylate cyclase [Candidatus Paceibacterota bacterium]|jgi:uncharacterized protein (TIGR00159 family)
MSYLTLFQSKDIIDVLLVALLIYFILVFIKQSKSFVVAYGAAIYLLIIYFARTLSLTLTREIFQILSTVFLLVFVVIFQRELRRFFDWIFISTRRLTHRRQRTISNDVSFSIIKAAQEMAAKKIGALIVLPGELPLEGIVEGGFVLEGRVSLPLILSIFDPTSPGHDGAMIIDNNRVKKFGVHLPLADNFSGFEKTGTRHRAAVGITQRTDALVIVVSEERGEISVASRGELKKIDNIHLLEEQISKFISVAQEPEFSHFWRVFLARNWWLKVLALFLALVLRIVL